MARRRINTIYAPGWKLREQKHVEDTLGMDQEICTRCGATLRTYHERCPADLTERCPGFQSIERAVASAPANCRP